MRKAILFDLDGTVLASKRGIFRSVAYALDRLELPIPCESELMAFLGPPLSDGFASVCKVPLEQISDAVRVYREYYNTIGKFDAEIYGGIRELLTALKKQGKRCYITTSKAHIFAREILMYFNIADLFDEIYGSELDGTRGKKSEVVSYCLEQQHLKPNETILVGDRHFDVNGAKEAGIDCVGVLYGYGSESELRAAGAAYIAKNVADLQELLLSL